MKRIFLLRAYGDFIVALQSLIYSRNPASFEVIASMHHRILFEALPASLIPDHLPIRFVDFGIKGPMLRAFTNRHLLHPDTINELHAVARFCKLHPLPTGENFAENIHRKWVIEMTTGEKFSAIAGNENVYNSYHSFFSTEPPVAKQYSEYANKVLILPSARVKKRDIPEHVVQKIMQKHSNQVVKIAYYKKEKSGCFTYNNFTDLVHLIEQADIIYGADSLPIHVSYLLLKPHVIVHPSGLSHQFFTPPAILQNAHFAFNQFT